MDHHHYHLHANCNRVNDFRMVCFQGGVQEITVRFLRVVRDSLRLCVFARTKKSRRSKRNWMIRLLMLSEESPAINPKHSDFNKYETYRGQRNQKVFMLFDMADQYIHPDKGWCKWKAYYSQAGEQENKCEPWMFVNMSMKTIKVDITID